MAVSPGRRNVVGQGPAAKAPPDVMNQCRLRCESLRDELFGRLLDDLLPDELGRDLDTLGVDGFE